MSNFIRRTKNPDTGQFEDAEWLDDYFGRHRYGVRFPGGGVVKVADGYDWEFEDPTSAVKLGEQTWYKDGHHPTSTNGSSTEPKTDGPQICGPSPDTQPEDDLAAIEAIEHEYRLNRPGHARQLLRELMTRERQAAHEAAYTQGRRDAYEDCATKGGDAKTVRGYAQTRAEQTAALQEKPKP
jgi:hypothetical protein